MKILRVLLLLAPFGLGLASAAHSAPASPATLHVFAAASLSEAFEDIAHQFEKSHAGVSVQLNLAGSQQLVAQIEAGAAADVFASADTAWMGRLVRGGRVDGVAAAFARNRLVVIVPKANPAHLSALQDLAKPGIKLVLGAETVPVGRYSRQVIDLLSKQPGYGSDFSKRALANLASEEENVKAVVSKVMLGEADAGIVYNSDVTPSVQRSTRSIEIPDAANVIATYPIAALSAAAAPDLARQFVSAVRSKAGQKTLQQHGFLSLPSVSP
jgi:molybdate transport system substrate-binding protein